MGSGALTFTLLIGIAVLAWASAYAFWPEVARARFVESLSQIRDEADDAILEGKLPDVPAVRYFVEKVDEMIAQSGRISLSFLAAVHTVQDDLGQKLKPGQPSFGSLSPSERKLIHALDRRIVDELTLYLWRGSRFAVLLYAAAFLAKTFGIPRKKAPQPSKLAAEYNRLSNRPEFQRGLQHAL